MPIRRLRLLALAIVSATAGASIVAAEMPTYGVGRAPTAEEIKAWDLTIPPDGRGLPPGSGTAVIGKGVFEEKCAPCHGPNADDPKYRLLVGRFRPLTAAQLPESIDPFVGGKPVLTIGNYWEYSTTLWSYIRRAQPYDEPGSLSVDQVYAVTAFLLYLNGIVGEQDVLDAKTLPQIKMPNRDGFVSGSAKGAKPGTNPGKGAR